VRVVVNEFLDLRIRAHRTYLIILNLVKMQVFMLFGSIRVRGATVLKSIL
jgi:hypothetical protein